MIVNPDKFQGILLDKRDSDNAHTEVNIGKKKINRLHQLSFWEPY